MMKQAFRSYLTSLHPRNSKKIKNSSSGSWIFYWVVTYPAIMASISDNSEFAEFIWFTMLKILPVFMMSWSNLSSRFLMPKAMFLSPMKIEERKKYINYVLLFKIGVPALLGVCIELIWSFSYEFHPLQMLAITFLYISIGISIYICFEKMGRADRKITFARKDKNGRVRWAWMNIVSLGVGIILLEGFELIDLTANADVSSNIVFVVGFAVLVILDTAILVTQYEDTIEMAGDYELTFNVMGKVEPVKYSIFE